MADLFHSEAIDQALEEFKRAVQQLGTAAAAAERLIRDTKPKLDAVLEEADLLLQRINAMLAAGGKPNS